jgi:hypothetical protein
VQKLEENTASIFRFKERVKEAAFPQVVKEGYDINRQK